jgi:hypothetical protein
MVIHYTEIVPKSTASPRPHVVEAQVPKDAKHKKILVKFGQHIRAYYSTNDPLGEKKTLRFLLVPTGAEFDGDLDMTYVDTVELFADTLLYHVYVLN